MIWSTYNHPLLPSISLGLYSGCYPQLQPQTYLCIYHLPSAVRNPRPLISKPQSQCTINVTSTPSLINSLNIPPYRYSIPYRESIAQCNPNHDYRGTYFHALTRSPQIPGLLRALRQPPFPQTMYGTPTLRTTITRYPFPLQRPYLGRHLSK